MLSIIEQVAPGTVHLLKQRYDILKQISQSSPVGRRVLAKQLGLSERILRAEIDILKNQGLIATSTVGMRLTSLGQQAFKRLEIVLNKQSDIEVMEEALAKKLNIETCSILKSDSPITLAQMTVDIIDNLLPEGESRVAVMGGTTLRSIAEAFDKSLSINRSLQFIPARGGTGEKASIQANTIADLMAIRTNGTSRLLYAPEHVRSEIHSLLMQEPEIKETLYFLSQSILAIFSIGEASRMAKRIGLTDEQINYLLDSGAVAEAFGEFIDDEGRVVQKLARVGLSSEDIRNIPYLIAVAGGKDKAQAIEAYFKVAPSHTYLITDEAAANEILNRDNPLK
ncbi:MAG TPA: sugar-binding domain-containing protein [Alloiococcus sp.]|nr:sugar-binding domain-containing protein [Alloiococcus sp.]